jgi:Fic family protein
LQRPRPLLRDVGGRRPRYTVEGLEIWCEYVLKGILEELQKVDQLIDFNYLKTKVITPALTHAKEREFITPLEEKILHITTNTGIAKAADFETVMIGISAPQRTYQIKKLVERRMVQPIQERARQYTIGFSNSYLIRGIVQALSNEGFIPSALNNTDK